MVTDVFALYVVKRGGFYKTKKYEEVDKKYEQKESYGIVSSKASPNEEQHLLRTIEVPVWHSDALVWTDLAFYEWTMLLEFFCEDLF